MSRKAKNKSISRVLLAVAAIALLLFNNFVVLQSMGSISNSRYSSEPELSGHELEPARYSFSPPVDSDVWYFSEEKKEWIVNRVVSMWFVEVVVNQSFVDDARLQYRLRPDYSFESDVWITTCTIDNRSYVLGLDTVDGNIEMGYPSKEGAFNISIEKACEIFEDAFGYSTETKLITVAGSRYWALLTDSARNDVPLVNVRSGEIVLMSELVDDYPKEPVNPLVLLVVGALIVVPVAVTMLFLRKRNQVNKTQGTEDEKERGD